jgi:glutamine synthetase
MAEYIWLDGGVKEFSVDYPHATQKLRSKTKILDPTKEYLSDGKVSLDLFPDWGYDGSSTGQAEGSSSDCVLKPVCAVPDPVRRKGNNFLVMCEVYTADGTPHSTNQRARLAKLFEEHNPTHAPLVGFEQEFCLFKGGRPLGWPEKGYPPAQGPFYCGVGSDEVAGRSLCEAHLDACLEAGIFLAGFNFEVMLGQAEFQIGYRGFEGESADLLTSCDHLWIARWILYRLGENSGMNATLHPKPVKGDWNGSGMHTNFSTLEMRGDGGMKEIETACNKIGERRKAHLDEYGEGYTDRLTGLHETCSYNQFKYGVSDRTASIRIPGHVAQKGRGYLEDRRPNANADPYRVAAVLVETVCG